MLCSTNNVGGDYHVPDLKQTTSRNIDTASLMTLRRMWLKKQTVVVVVVVVVVAPILWEALFCCYL